MPPLPEFIRALQDPKRYDHPVTAVTVLETHISWVLLTGAWAYKIKKPVNLGFVDFSTLERRHFFCDEELRLNRRLAAQLYRDVVAITGTPRDPTLNGSGTAFEYAVRMREFPQEALLDRLLARGAVPPAQIDRIAEVIARFHESAGRAGPSQPFGDPQRVHAPVRDNFLQIEPLLPDAPAHARLARLRAWSEAEYQRLREALNERKDGGFVRECHGDMHLGNMAWIGEDVAIFDCLEFNEALRWIDVISETAFLHMDLEDRGRADLAHRFLDAYLQHTGDYAGLALLRYYRTYRALVRAKVAAIRSAQKGLGESARARALQTCSGYLEFAERAAAPQRPFLLLTYGLSGSGKTTAAQYVLEELGAVRLRSDVERKRMFHLAPGAGSHSAPGAGIYTAEADRATYARLEALAADVLAARHPVIVDATFLERERRLPFYALGRDLGVPVAVLELCPPAPLLQARIASRRRAGQDASEADAEILQRQRTRAEPPAQAERGAVHMLSAATEAEVRAVPERLRTWLAQTPAPQ